MGLHKAKSVSKLMMQKLIKEKFNQNIHRNLNHIHINILKTKKQSIILGVIAWKTEEIVTNKKFKACLMEKTPK